MRNIRRDRLDRRLDEWHERLRSESVERKRAVIEGKISSMRVAPQASSPSLEVEVWDETGGITLHFLGRERIHGLVVGATVRAEGMVGEHDGAFAIYNPSYVLLPGGSPP